MLTCSYRSLIYILFAWMLAACGGGGGGGGVDPSDGNIDTGNSGLRTFSLSLTDASGNAITEVSDNTPGVINALLTDNDGNAIVGEIVTFSLNGSIGTLNPSSGTALTDSSGIAQISLFAGTTGGAGTVSASASFAIAASLNFESAGDSPESEGDSNTAVGTTLELDIQKTDGTSFDFTDDTNPEEVSQNTPAVLVATLTNSDGPLAGEVITFETTAGTLTLSSDITDINGQAAVSLDAGAVPGVGTATATYSGTNRSASFITAGDNTSLSTEDSVISATLTQTDGTTALPNDIVTASLTGLVTFTVTKSGSPRSNQILTVSLDNGNATLNPANADGVANIITDSNGQATVEIEAGDVTGADSISVSGDGVTFAAITSFGVQSSDIQLGTGSGGTFTEGVLDISGTQPLPAGTSTTISVNLVDNNNSDALFTTPTTVNFSSLCASQNRAQLDTNITSFNGTATATYIPTGSAGTCSGSDTITASAEVGSQTPSAQSSLTIDTADAATIQQDGDANPTLIALANTTGLNRSTSSTITFLVEDENGNPVDNSNSVTVNFELTTEVGGITLSQTSQDTNINGQVSVLVNAGTVPTPVRVRAFFTDDSGNTVSTVSEQLVISTGIPDQNSFSVSVDQHNILGWGYNNVEVNITASGADQFNNPMPDQTAVSFSTELGGRIDGNCVVDNGTGDCSVVWRTSGDRAPADQTTGGVTSSGKNDRFGRTTIVGYLQGEESFTDLDGDNSFDTGESFADIPEAFVDYNESGVYDSTFNPPTSSDPLTNAAWQAVDAEIALDFNNNSSYDNADGNYNGSLCDSAGANDCDDFIFVRRSNVIISSTDELRFYVFTATSYDDSSLDFIEQGTQAAPTPPSTALNTVIDGITSGAQTGVTTAANGYNSNLTTVTDIDFTATSTTSLVVYITDLNGNPAAQGTSISFDCSECDIDSGDSYTVPDTTEPFALSLILSEDTGTTDDGTLTATYTLPDTNSTTYAVDLGISISN